MCACNHALFRSNCSRCLRALASSSPSITSSITIGVCCLSILPTCLAIRFHFMFCCLISQFPHEQTAKPSGMRLVQPLRKIPPRCARPPLSKGAFSPPFDKGGRGDFSLREMKCTNVMHSGLGGCAPRTKCPGQRNGAQAHPTNFVLEAAKCVRTSALC